MAGFDAGDLRAIDVWHRRAGKDLAALHHGHKSAWKRRGAYWHFFPTLEQARKAIWEGFTSDGQRIMDTVFPKELVRRRNEQQMSLELTNGSLFRLMGTDKIESVGAGPVGVTFSEYSLCKPTSWELVRPMLRENGGWAWFIFTPRGYNHAKRLFDQNLDRPGWRVRVRTVRDTGLTYTSVRDPTKVLSPDEMMQEVREEGMPESLIRQEYLCDFSAANVGSVWGDLMEVVEKRGDTAAFDHPGDGVFTSWDLGISDSTAIWFWRIEDDRVSFIDYYEAHGKPLSHFFDEVDGRGYRYLKHWLPHDAKARTLVTGSSIIEQCVARYGPGAVALVPSVSLLDGIQAGRWLLQRPGVRFHSRCSVGIEALKQYHYEWDADRRTFSGRPEHDWSSHGADAWRYAAVVMKASNLIRPEKPKEPFKALEPERARLVDVWEEVDAKQRWRR